MTPLEQAEERIQEYYGGIWTKEGWVVKGDLSLWSLSLPALPKIKSVGGYFNCWNNQLTNLVGSPKMVGGDFYCSHNQLTSLTGSPKMVGGYFYCHGNPLTSLSGLPDKIGGEFWCDDNLALPKEEIIFLIKAHPGNLEQIIKKIKWI